RGRALSLWLVAVLLRPPVTPRVPPQLRAAVAAPLTAAVAAAPHSGEGTCPSSCAPRASSQLIVCRTAGSHSRAQPSWVNRRSSRLPVNPHTQPLGSRKPLEP